MRLPKAIHERSWPITTRVNFTLDIGPTWIVLLSLSWEKNNYCQMATSLLPTQSRHSSKHHAHDVRSVAFQNIVDLKLQFWCVCIFIHIIVHTMICQTCNMKQRCTTNKRGKMNRSLCLCGMEQGKSNRVYTYQHH